MTFYYTYTQITFYYTYIHVLSISYAIVVTYIRVDSVYYPTGNITEII